MSWLTWRQFRIQALVAGIVLAALAIIYGYTGPHLAASVQLQWPDRLRPSFRLSVARGHLHE